ncbi:polyprenyl synthetase family protein [Kitasatospora misakiensis]|uniref:Polyprenyl synthetase family protein n=1 Tax=Kitasatospora misakiensis TaxID=67330 RepID=A0ABW0WV33_9ACTN
MTVRENAYGYVVVMVTAAEGVVGEFDFPALRGRVDETLESLLDAKAKTRYGAHLGEALGALRGFLAGGGKRVRPLFCCVGWHAAGGGVESRELLRIAAGLELFHAFALLHDDVIDGSETRRGAPTVHRVLAARGVGPRGDWYGRSAAVLLGDLCEVWADELFGGVAGGSEVSPRVLLDRMREEMLVGQLLDLGSGSGPGTVRQALQVIRYKTTQYTVKRPLQIGAALAGADGPVLDALAAYADPLGEAFQLLDDLEDLEDVCEGGGRPGLGGEDLREGKRTVVLAVAVERASAAQAGRLRELVGAAGLDDAGVREARALIRETGAPDIVRRMITERRRQALAVVDRGPFPTAAKPGLTAMADLALPGVARWDGGHEEEDVDHR